jgi:energy-coupling factor transporter ATP-binding protein EcfA2
MDMLVEDATKDCILESSGKQLERPLDLELAAYDVTDIGDAFLLIEISDVHGVNNLQEGARLPFDFQSSMTGLNVVYGENGSGKTGFSRILKASAGKVSASQLLGNVYLAGKATQQWSIKYGDAYGTNVFEQKLGSQIPDVLKTIQIFDEDLANSYRIHDRELSINPPILRLFDDLIHGIDRVRIELTRIIDGSVSALPKLPDHLDRDLYEKILRTLRNASSEDSFRLGLTFNERDAKSLSDLTAEISLFTSADAIKALQKKQELFLAAYNVLDGQIANYREEKIKEIGTLYERVMIAEKAVTAANELLSAQAHLPDVGSSKWHHLWQAAKQYSTDEAYPGEVFPVVSEGALCVLCQQALSREAAKRFVDFQAYVEGAAATSLKNARLGLENRIKLIPQLDGLTNAFSSLEAYEEFQVLSDKAVQCRTELTLALEVLQSFPFKEVSLKTALAMLESLSSIQSKLKIQISQVLDPELAKARESKIASHKQLSTKKWISEQIEAMVVERARLILLANIEKARSVAITTDTTIEKGRLYEQLVTEEVSKNFTEELKRLAPKGLPISLTKQKSTKGKVLHKPILLGTKFSASTQEVLSEGEQRIVALSAFLADTTTSASKSPFIFDDPVSSLDHKYEAAVSHRLAELAATRQVIVFTHRLSFVFALRNASKKVGNSRQDCQVYATEKSSGNHSDFPFDRNPKTLANKIKNSCALLRKESQGLPPDQKRDKMLSSYAAMRMALERSVEKVLLNGIVGRFDQAVHTDNNIRGLAVIQLSDCELIDRLMTKYSREIHTQADEIDDGITSIDDLEADAIELISWIEEYSKRFGGISS